MPKKELSLEEKVNYLYEKTRKDEKIAMIKSNIYWGFRLIIVTFVIWIRFWVNWKIDQTQKYISHMLNPQVIQEQMVKAIKQSKDSVLEKGGELWDKGKNTVKGLFGN